MSSYHVFEFLRDDYRPMENFYMTEQYVGDELNDQLHGTLEDLLQGALLRSSEEDGI